MNEKSTAIPKFRFTQKEVLEHPTLNCSFISMELVRSLRLSFVAVSVGFLMGSSAPAATQFTVGSYNLENYLLHPIGTRPAKPDDARRRIVESLVALNADVLALQELGGSAALTELSSRLANAGVNYPYREMVTGADTNIQLAVLSQFPIVKRVPHTNDYFLVYGRRFQVSRGFLEVEIQVAPDYRLTLFNAHLKSRRRVSYADEAELRESEARILRKKITERLDANPDANIVVLGDLNDTQDSRPVRELIGRGKKGLIDTRPAEQNGDDQPNRNPKWHPRNVAWTHYYGKEDSYSRIDYILLSQGLAREWTKDGTRILTFPNWGVGSDHRPLIASFVNEDR